MLFTLLRRSQKSHHVVLSPLNLQYTLHPPTQLGLYKFVKTPRILFQVAHVVRPDVGHGVDRLAQILRQATNRPGQNFDVGTDEGRELSELMNLYILSSIELKVDQSLRMGEQGERRRSPLLQNSLVLSYLPLSNR